MNEKANRGDTPRRDTPRRDTPRSDTPVINRESERGFGGDFAIEIVVGQLIAERFKVLSFLGKGGMGAVYLVEEVHSHKRYALKTISAKDTSDRELKRFQLEAKATSLLKHPNLIQFKEFGLIEGVQPYFVMDYCEGRTLAGLIKRQGPCPVERALPMFISIANALAYAHSQGVVHRDLKPSNIMLTGKDVKVLDFGIAKVLRDETAFNTLTQTGEIFGSPYYMSPEQCMGTQIDHRSDIYSLGCVFFETLTGAPPFMSENPLATMLKHQSIDPPTLKEATLGREYAPDLERIIAMMLSKNPDTRYQDLLRVADDLRSVQKGESLGSSRPEHKKPSPPREYVAVAVGVVVLAIAISAFLLQPQVRFAQIKLGHAPTDTKTLPAASTGRFYSDPTSGKIRQFYFPNESIGKYGYSKIDVPDNEGLFTPAQGPKNNVEVPFNFVATSAAPDVLARFRDDEVSRLVLKGNILEPVDDKTVKQIKNWRELKSLNLNNAEIDDRSIACLQTLPKLIDLSVEGTHLSPTGLRQLQLARFYRLNLNRMLYAKELLPTLGSRKLERLYMAGTELNDNDIKMISQFPSLSDLDIRDNPISDRSLEYLVNANDGHLQRLWIRSKNITPRSIDSFKKMKGLQGLAITPFNWSDTDKALLRKTLEAKGCKVAITDE